MLERPTRLLLCFSSAVFFGGCYQGVDGNGPAIDEGDEGGPGGADGADDGEDPPRVPPPPEEDHPFDVPSSEVEVLPFHVRVNNLAHVAGVDVDHVMFGDVYARRYQLGDHDHANLVSPNLKWSPDHMEAWVKALGPVCSSPELQARYPDLATDPTALVRAAFARDADPEELAAFDEVAGGQIDAAGRHRMVCLAVLSSLEFVAR